MNTQETCKTIADQLVQAEGLGYARLVSMVGAKHFSFDGKAPYANLSFKISNRKWNHCKIEHRGDDTYTMTIGKYTLRKTVRKETFEGVHWDQLKGLFEETTGLYLSLR